jgi:hypothetical protein
LRALYAFAPANLYLEVMDVTGLVIGVAGLAGLFGSCIDAIDRVDSYRKFGYESRYISAWFHLDKLLFQRWADAVGN